MAEARRREDAALRLEEMVDALRLSIEDFRKEHRADQTHASVWRQRFDERLCDEAKSRQAGFAEVKQMIGMVDARLTPFEQMKTRTELPLKAAGAVVSLSVGWFLVEKCRMFVAKVWEFFK